MAEHKLLVHRRKHCHSSVFTSYGGLISGVLTHNIFEAHINHVRNVAGVDHVGIGADFDGVSQMPIGLEDVSKYPSLFQRLADSRTGEPDWNEHDLKKLAALNLVRVFKKVEQVKETTKKTEPNEERIPAEDLGNNTCRS